MRYNPSQKIAIIKEVVEDKQSVYSVCKKNSLSKVTFYKWLSIYKRARKNRHASFASHIKEGSDHYKSLNSNNKLKILAQVHSNPKLSCHQISQNLGVGNHAVQNLLEKEGLGHASQRVEYSQKPFWKRETAQRRQGMMELYEQGWQIDSICRHYKISKPTFFKWRQRYLEAKELGNLLTLSDRYIAGNAHHRYIDEAVKDRVVELVAHNPDWSVHRIAASFAKTEGKPVIGHHGIQDLLLTRDLNTLEKRRLYAQGFVRQLSPAIQIYETPVPSLSVWRLLYAPFKTVPKWVLKHPASWPIVFPVTIFLAWIIEVDKLFNPVFFFPTIALTFGMFFFLYSLKYYFSLIMVMKVAQGGEGTNNPDVDVKLDQGPQSFAMRIKNIIGKSIKISQPISKVNPLALNFSTVELKSKPFVSIHAPIYNEKRVVERLIKACSSQNWYDDASGKANFEVVIIDDSTDDTTEIVKQKLSEDGRKLSRSVSNPEMEVYISEAVDGSTIKLIHRFNRHGYKGAALGNAMNYIDPRAQYVCVFDADFVPYPDTIEQFMKSFQEACGGLENVAESKIAAVQGYQWHVLNKSENWVTRGVRTEYAGSYVVERAGIGIYGGLNQIAGSVFCIRVDVLRAFGWKTSITEDLQLTLRLYEQGFKVVFNPYIQAPAEAVSTVKRLIRQRMRWAEGHTFNVKQMWQKMMYSERISGREKFEFMYLAPYYLQAAFFLIGVSAWFISEVVIHTRLPFWTAAWGWSLVFTNFLALPLMNLAGLFLEESEEKDYVGVASFMLLSYIVVPFQAYAAVKALFETEEGPWFRTPKSGLITDNFDRGRFYGWVEKLKTLRGVGPNVAASSQMAVGGAGLGFGRLNLARVSAHNPLQGYRIMPRRTPRVSRGLIAGLLIAILFINYLGFFAPQPAEANHGGNHLEQQYNIIDQIISSTTAAVLAPDGTTATADLSLGAVKYPATGELTSATNYFEAVMKTTNVNVGQYSSMVLDGSGFPVIAYYNATNGDLDLIHCGNANCSSGNTINTVDGCSSGCNSTNNLGQGASLALDSSGNPVIAYWDDGNGAVKVVVCNDANCASQNETYTTVKSNTGGFSTSQTVYLSLKIDSTSATCTSATKNCPVIAYYDRDMTAGVANADLRLIHCTVNGCSTKNDNAVETTNDVGQYNSMQLASSGFPVISYFDATNADLRVATCSDVNCTTAATITNVDSTGSVGSYTSLVLDQASATCTSATKNCPVIAYRDDTNAKLKVVHCTVNDCSGTPNINTPDPTANRGMYTSIKLDGSGFPVVSYYDNSAVDLILMHCDDVNCAGGNENINTVDSTGFVGKYTSLALDGSGFPVIAFYDETNLALKLAHCNDANCNGGNENLNTADAGTPTAMSVGLYPTGSNTAVTSSTLTTTSNTYTRQRSAAITLTASAVYTTRYKFSSTPVRGTLYLQAARLIVTQNPGASNVTASLAMAELGDYQTGFTSANPTYVDITNSKMYCFNSQATSTSCTDAGTNVVWNPTPTAYFEATLWNNTGGSITYAQLYDITAAAAVGSSPVSVTGTSPALARSTAITLTAGHEYKVQVSVSANSGTIANAKIIFTQSAGGGITKTETLQMYTNHGDASAEVIYTTHYYTDQLARSNVQNSGASTKFYFEAVIYAVTGSSTKGGTSYSSNAQLYNYTDSAAITNAYVSNASQSVLRYRSSELSAYLPAQGTTKDLVIQQTGMGTSTMQTNDAWLIVQLQDLNVPEISIVAVPFAFAFPRLAKKIRELMAKRKKKKGGQGAGGKGNDK